MIEGVQLSEAALLEDKQDLAVKLKEADRFLRENLGVNSDEERKRLLRVAVAPFIERESLAVVVYLLSVGMKAREVLNAASAAAAS